MDQTAVGSFMEQHLSEPIDDQGVKATARDREDKSGQDGRAQFREEVFHRPLNKFEGGNDHIDQFDSKERNNHAAEAVNKQVALQNRQSANGFIDHTSERQRNE